MTFSAPTYQAAYDGVLALVRAARAGYSGVLAENVRKLPEDKQIMANYSDSLFMRWMDYEWGRWKPPVPPPSSNKTFHGDR